MCGYINRGDKREKSAYIKNKVEINKIKEFNKKYILQILPTSCYILFNNYIFCFVCRKEKRKKISFQCKSKFGLFLFCFWILFKSSWLYKRRIC